ncbi:hypothetical protein [Nocardioides yefusunii]|uniref:Uncharacterized protein n=1 Tax=Nocardioides yefusunii TaxID=2500546 RepID=A0ABW1QRR8_9ACTN|nr:hypothetical protein [Nocardioides yefusunii]
MDSTTAQGLASLLLVTSIWFAAHAAIRVTASHRISRPEALAQRRVAVVSGTLAGVSLCGAAVLLVWAVA